MREAAADHPESFVESDSINDESLAFPVTDGIAEITRDDHVLGWMFSSRIHGDPAPVPIFAGDQEEAIEFGLVDDIEPVWNGEETHAAGGIAPGMRIIQSVARLAILIKRARPVLEGNFVKREIRWQRRSVPSEDVSLHDIPETLFGRAPRQD